MWYPQNVTRHLVARMSQGFCFFSVPTWDVRPLTKSIEHYKHNIYVAPKEEVSKSPEKANHNAIKIDRGFSM